MGIIFLGTPHRGSDWAAWGGLAQRVASAALFDTNGKTLKDLKPDGKALFQLSENFGRLIARRTIKIYTFEEALGFKGIKGLNGRASEFHITQAYFS